MLAQQAAEKDHRIQVIYLMITEVKSKTFKMNFLLQHYIKLKAKFILAWFMVVLETESVYKKKVLNELYGLSDKTLKTFGAMIGV